MLLLAICSCDIQIQSFRFCKNCGFAVNWYEFTSHKTTERGKKEAQTARQNGFIVRRFTENYTW